MAIFTGAAGFQFTTHIANHFPVPQRTISGRQRCEIPLLRRYSH